MLAVVYPRPRLRRKFLLKIESFWVWELIQHAMFGPVRVSRPIVPPVSPHGNSSPVATRLLRQGHLPEEARCCRPLCQEPGPRPRARLQTTPVPAVRVDARSGSQPAGQSALPACLHQPIPPHTSHPSHPTPYTLALPYCPTTPPPPTYRTTTCRP